MVTVKVSKVMVDPELSTPTYSYVIVYPTRLTRLTS